MLLMLLIMILLGEIQNKNFIYINIFIMLYQIKKIGNYYQVKNKDTRQIKAKRTTKNIDSRNGKNLSNIIDSVPVDVGNF